MERLQAKLRRNDLVRESARYEFYDRRIPADVYDGVRLAQWLRRQQGGQPQQPGKPRLLFMVASDVLAGTRRNRPPTHSPTRCPAAPSELALQYKFEPGADDDGVTLTVPMAELLGRSGRAGRLARAGPVGAEGRGVDPLAAQGTATPARARARFRPPRRRADRVRRRRHARGGCGGAGPLSGQRIGPATSAGQLPAELQMNVRMVDAGGEVVAAGRDLEALRRELGCEKAANRPTSAIRAGPATASRRGTSTSCPSRSNPPRRSRVHGVPDARRPGESVSLRLADSASGPRLCRAADCGDCFYWRRGRDVKNQVDWLPNLEKMRLAARGAGGFCRAGASWPS